jgi:chromosome partitioning protein
MIISFQNSKGGPGKSTLSIQMTSMLANEGYKTLLIDTDKGKTTMNWKMFREQNEVKPEITCMEYTKPSLHKDIKAFDNFDFIVIDGSANDDLIFRSVCLASDVIICPCMISVQDFMLLQDSLSVIEEKTISKPVKNYVLFNGVNERTTLWKQAQEMKPQLEENFDCKVLDNHINYRNVYKTSYAVGKGVVEMTGNEKDIKAIEELEKVYEEIKERLSNG